jgi:hypothetical protein
LDTAILSDRSLLSPSSLLLSRSGFVQSVITIDRNTHRVPCTLDEVLAWFS